MLQQEALAIAIPRQLHASAEVTYQLDGTFFKLFENSLLEQGQLAVKVKLDKSPRHIQLLFKIKGEVELVCDRSLEPFYYPIAIEQVVHFKLGEEDKELDLDFYMIDQQASTINLAQHIYDFVTLAIPMKKLHPRFKLGEEET